MRSMQKHSASVPFQTVSFSFPLAGVVVINGVTYFTISAGIWFESLFPVSRHRLIGLMPAGGGIMGSFKCLRWTRILIYSAHIFNIVCLYLDCHFNEAPVPKEMLLIIISARGHICLHEMHTHRLVQSSVPRVLLLAQRKTLLRGCSLIAQDLMEISKCFIYAPALFGEFFWEIKVYRWDHLLTYTKKYRDTGNTLQ